MWYLIFGSILSISADIETIGEILKKIIPTLEEVGFFCYNKKMLGKLRVGVLSFIGVY